MTEEGCIVCLDPGEVRIGVAVSDPLGILASAHSVIQVSSTTADVEAVRKVVEERAAVTVVVGLPLDLHGEVGVQARKVLEFVDVLRDALEIEVVTQDERFSTAAAERMLIQADLSRKGRKKVIDKVSAQLILQLYLDRRANLKNRPT